MPVFPVRTIPDPHGYFPLSESDCHHLKVLRLVPGDHITVSFPDGSRGEAKIEEIAHGWQGKLLRSLDETTRFPFKLWIGCGTIRPQRMEWLIEKLTEMNLWRFTPLYMQFSRNTSKRPFSEHRLTRLHKIAQEALKQCEGSGAPEIFDPMALPDWLNLTEEISGKKIFLQARTQAQALVDFELDPNANHALLIGPEGGFSPEEVDKLQSNHFTAASLGKGILRTETAAIIATALLQNPRGLA